MSKEKNLWLKKLKFLLGARTSKEKNIDLIKYSFLWYFKRKAPFISIDTKEASELLISDCNKEKFLLYVNHSKFSSSFFSDYLCENGSEKQILQAAKTNVISSTSFGRLASRFDDKFLEQFFKSYKLGTSYYRIIPLIENGHENALIAYLEYLLANNHVEDFSSRWGRYHFEVALCNSNLNKAKEVYLSSSFVSDYARIYIINSKNKKRIEQILDVSCDISECIALLKTKDEHLEMLAVKYCLKHDFRKNEFIDMLLASNNVKAVKEYIKNVVLSNEQELCLIKNFDDNVIKFYLEENKQIDFLNNDSLQYVFDYKSPDLKEFLYLKMGYPYELERKLIKENNEEKIKVYIKNFELYPLNECLLMQIGSKELINEYAYIHKLYRSSEIFLIRRCDREIINSYLKILSQKEEQNNRLLSDEALIEFVLKGDIDDVISYISSNDLFHCIVAKYSLIRGDERLIKISKNKIDSQLIEFISKYGEPDVLVKLFYNRDVTFHQTAQCYLCSRKEIMVDTKPKPLNIKKVDTNLKFIKSNNELPAIAEFIKNYPLCAKAQELLFNEEFFNEEVIMLYISLYELDEEVVKMNFNKPQCKNIFEEYIERYPLSDRTIYSSII